MALIVYLCPTCKTYLSAYEDKAGTKQICPSCGQKLEVPAGPAQPTLNKTVLGEVVPATPLPAGPQPPAGALRPSEPPPVRRSAAERRRRRRRDDYDDDADDGYDDRNRRDRDRKPEPSEYSTLGVISLIIGVICLLIAIFLVVLLVVGARREEVAFDIWGLRRRRVNEFSGLLCALSSFGLPLAFLGLGLGIGGFFEGARKQLITALGVILNGAMLLLIFFVFITSIVGG
jgi:DNA-directed RNA polymerase subunit RPC12/RpoP